MSNSVFTSESVLEGMVFLVFGLFFFFKVKVLVTFRIWGPESGYDWGCSCTPKQATKKHADLHDYNTLKKRVFTLQVTHTILSALQLKPEEVCFGLKLMLLIWQASRSNFNHLEHLKTCH